MKTFKQLQKEYNQGIIDLDGNMSKGNHVCYLCGKPCYGSTCKDCFRKGKYKSIGRKDSRRKHYARQVQHPF